jgi:hypothetical protein
MMEVARKLVLMLEWMLPGVRSGDKVAVFVLESVAQWRMYYIFDHGYMTDSCA